MNTNEHQLMIHHDHWANLQVKAMLLNMEIIPERARRIFDHILGAQSTWIGRIRNIPCELEIWPLLQPEQWQTIIDKHHQELVQIANNHTLLDSVITYQNSKGQSFTNKVSELLIHLSLHGQYHRGQIIAYTRDQIEQPPITDMIAFLRL